MYNDSMKRVSLIWNIHQPFRVRKYQVFDVGTSTEYFLSQDSAESETTIANRFSKEVYKPLFEKLLALSEKDGMRFGLACSGTVLDIVESESSDALHLLKNLSKTGAFELLATSHHNTPAFLYSETEFNRQVKMHRRKVQKLFNKHMDVFFVSGSPLTRELAIWADKQGYRGVVGAVHEKLYEDMSPHDIYLSEGSRTIPFAPIVPLSRITQKSYTDYLALLTDYVLKDRSEKEIPVIVLDVQDLFTRTGSLQETHNALGVFFDELKKNGIEFVTPSERLAQRNESLPVFSIPPQYHEVTFFEWNKNSMQREALAELYSLEESIKKARNALLIESWRRLQALDNFFAMDIQSYETQGLIPYYLHESPYDAFIAYMNVLKDLEERATALLEDQTLESPVTKIPIRIQETA